MQSESFDLQVSKTANLQNKVCEYVFANKKWDTTEAWMSSGKLRVCVFGHWGSRIPRQVSNFKGCISVSLHMCASKNIITKKPPVQPDIEKILQGHNLVIQA